jgi:hypothetical protein
MSATKARPRKAPRRPARPKVLAMTDPRLAALLAGLADPAVDRFPLRHTNGTLARVLDRGEAIELVQRCGVPVPGADAAQHVQAEPQACR